MKNISFWDFAESFYHGFMTAFSLNMRTIVLHPTWKAVTDVAI